MCSFLLLSSGQANVPGAVSRFPIIARTMTLMAPVTALGAVPT